MSLFKYRTNFSQCHQCYRPITILSILKNKIKTCIELDSRDVFMDNVLCRLRVNILNSLKPYQSLFYTA